MSKHAALDTFGRSVNPVIRSSAFNQRSSSTEVMTLDGAVNKIGIMLVYLFLLPVFHGFLMATQS